MTGPSISRSATSADSIPNVTWPTSDQELRIADIPDVIRSFTDDTRFLNRLVDGDLAIPLLVAVYTGLTFVTWVSQRKTLLTSGCAALD